MTKLNKKPSLGGNLLLRSLKQVFDEYVKVSSIQGLKYIQDENAPLIFKFIWLVVIVISFILCNLLVMSFWIRYKSTPTKMRVASNHNPLPTLKMPAITFCPINRINGKRAMLLIDQLALPSNVSKEILKRAFYQASGFVDLITYNETELQMLHQVLTTNELNVSQTMELLQQPCDELFVKCRLERVVQPCQQLFKPSFAYYGNCCTFNSNGEFTKANFISAMGGLSLVMTPEIDENQTSVYSDGIKILVHETGVFGASTSFEKMISHKTETFVRLSTVVTTCSDEVRQLPYSDRGCLYESERQLKHFTKYREANCNLECLLERIIDMCDCLPYYLPQVEGIAICDFTKIKCLVDNYWILNGNGRNNTRTCECMSNCNDLYYDGVTNKAMLFYHNLSTDPIHSALNESHMVVHITFGKQVYRSLRKDLMTNILSLAANLGGIYSLFIGFSALTFFEFIYYFVVRFYITYRKISA